MNMILRSDVARQAPPWRTALKQCVTDPEELLRLLELDPHLTPLARRAVARFGLRVPRGYVARMRRRDRDDPLLRQVLPLAEEDLPSPGFCTDPVGDLAAMASTGVLRKYQGRALLITTGACGVHCRYCFRRHFPYSEGVAAGDHGSAAFQYIREDPSVREVILSGGDPLMLSDRRLAEMVSSLAQIPHVVRVRVHTRMPIVLPERIDDSLLEWCSRSHLKFVFVVHANHPNELDGAVRQALAKLADGGSTLLNQAVLLRGVNDSSDTLVALSEALFSARVLPYYLHMLDRVAGAAHFEVADSVGLELMGELRKRLPGYLVPRLVREQAASEFKLPLSG